MLLELCRINKGVYIKIGQHIGALENLFPKEYTDTLKVLHSQAPITPLKYIYKVIKEDLKHDVRCSILRKYIIIFIGETVKEKAP